MGQRSVFGMMCGVGTTIEDILSDLFSIARCKDAWVVQIICSSEMEVFNGT
jgi:hypothetical protein